MHRDLTFNTGSTLRTVFVSYTTRLKENVRFIYEKMCHQEVSPDSNYSLGYCTIKTMVEHLFEVTATPQLQAVHEEIAKQVAQCTTDFHAEGKKVTYVIFRDEFWKTISEPQKRYIGDNRIEMIMTPLLAWTQIYSFIKGSIDAAIRGQPLSRDAYLELGKKRVRLTPEGRDVAYLIFESYQHWLRSHGGLWDQPDFVLETCQRVKLYIACGEEPLYHRVYIDEVQDLTQAEIGLLITSTGNNSNGFFFAGGNASHLLCAAIYIDSNHILFKTHISRYCSVHRQWCKLPLRRSQRSFLRLNSWRGFARENASPFYEL